MLQREFYSFNDYSFYIVDNSGFIHRSIAEKETPLNKNDLKFEIDALFEPFSEYESNLIQELKNSFDQISEQFSELSKITQPSLISASQTGTRFKLEENDNVFFALDDRGSFYYNTIEEMSQTRILKQIPTANQILDFSCYNDYLVVLDIQNRIFSIDIGNRRSGIFYDNIQRQCNIDCGRVLDDDIFQGFGKRCSLIAQLSGDIRYESIGIVRSGHICRPNLNYPLFSDSIKPHLCYIPHGYNSAVNRRHKYIRFVIPQKYQEGIDLESFFIEEILIHSYEIGLCLDRGGNLFYFDLDLNVRSKFLFKHGYSDARPVEIILHQLKIGSGNVKSIFSFRNQMFIVDSLDELFMISVTDIPGSLSVYRVFVRYQSDSCKDILLRKSTKINSYINMTTAFDNRTNSRYFEYIPSNEDLFIKAEKLEENETTLVKKLEFSIACIDSEIEDRDIEVKQLIALAPYHNLEDKLDIKIRNPKNSTPIGFLTKSAKRAL